MDLHTFLHRGTEIYLPNLSLDHVILGYSDEKLQCLLLQTGERWSLPGGLIYRKESVEEAIARILKERTGLQHGHQEFLGVFGKTDRSFSEHWKRLIEGFGEEWKKELWINDRFVTLAYYSLVNMQEVHPVAGEYNQSVRWYPVTELPEMWMDHAEIIAVAHNKLKQDIQKEPISSFLLEPEFTMPDLHRLHQTILEQDLDRSRFQKKMLASGRFERLTELASNKPGRNPFRYRLKSE